MYYPLDLRLLGMARILPAKPTILALQQVQDKPRFFDTPSWTIEPIFLNEDKIEWGQSRL